MPAQHRWRHEPDMSPRETCDHSAAARAGLVLNRRTSRRGHIGPIRNIFERHMVYLKAVEQVWS